ncbi:hypothetical protein ACFQ34_17245 [Pseudonocardia benzenivorans]|uniref:Uncharacterized protein n=1 Tax=Pseudonocardia benzenivorans TaxID=228005 RepID=A0ABW3VLT0_9PSEU
MDPTTRARRPRTAALRLAGGPGDMAFWVAELAHRAADPDAVARAVAAIEPAAAPLLRPAAGAPPESLVALDPLRDRPYLDDDPDAAVLVDVLLTGLSRPRAEYPDSRVWAADRIDGPDDLAGRHRAVRALLDLDSIYATPECRARLEGRARYNLATEERATRG